ncbi:hypothetical protein ABZ863_06420 [Saccharomonospora sp. NPDC046836]|uniref:hypothetical protein n=1 Tax=Saccharomonospora sp. NPDC046836 TaxID=3156921 RepID=UPI0033EA4349
MNYGPGAGMLVRWPTIPSVGYSVAHLLAITSADGLVNGIGAPDNTIDGFASRAVGRAAAP